MNTTANAQAPQTVKTDLLVLLIGQTGWDEAPGLSAIDGILSGSLLELAKAEGFEGKFAQSFTLHTLGNLPASRVMLLGTGDAPLRHDRIRDLGGHVAQKARATRAASVAISAPWGTDGFALDAGIAVRLVLEGLLLGSYHFSTYLSEKPKAPELEEITLLTQEVIDDINENIQIATAIAAGTNLARDLGNEPPNICTPAFLADASAQIAARYGMDATILGPDAIAAKGFNLVIAVGQGARDEPRFIHLIYRGEGTTKRKLAFVGKGVTFDTGGYSLKPPAGQQSMHLDMCGAAAVIGAAESIGRLAPKNVEIHFIVPSVKNAVSDNAYTVNEIIKGYGGKTVEILNTDAEGRLILADALAYASELDVDTIIDLATLTGSCVVALGEQYSGLFSNTDDFAHQLLMAAHVSGERIWHMPLDDKLKEKLKSPVADMKNVGDRWGGAITAALFLEEWVDKKTWAHLDIAGPAINEQDLPTTPKGASGTGVALLTTYALGQHLN